MTALRTFVLPIDFIDPGAANDEPVRNITNGHLRQWCDRDRELQQKLIRVHRALDDALGDSDITHVENDRDLRSQHPMQWAEEQLAKIIDDL